MGKILKYISIPFIWIYYSVQGGLPIMDDGDQKVDKLRGRMLWEYLKV